MHKEKSYSYFKVYIGFRMAMFCPMLSKAASECFEQVSEFTKDDDGVYYCVMRTCEYDSPDDVLKQLWDFGAVHVEAISPFSGTYLKTGQKFDEMSDSELEAAWTELYGSAVM